MITRRRPCPAAPGPLEGYAARFDDLFGSLAQRRGFREYLAGLLALRDRNKTLTALAGAEPVAGAQHAAVQRLQFCRNCGGILSGSTPGRWSCCWPTRAPADKATWYLATNLPRPGGPREPGSVHPAADLAEIVRIYGIRHWIEQSYKHVKDELGWADFQVRSTSRSAATRPWSTARSASAGLPGSLITRRSTILRHRGQNLAAERGGPRPALPPPGAVRAGRCARYEPGFPRQSRCGAGGSHGRKRPRRRSCKP